MAIGRVAELSKGDYFDRIILSYRMVDNKENNNLETNGVVIEALPNLMFKVKLDNGEEQLSILAGKMRYHRIKILVGDKVTVLLDSYGGKARIIRRL